ncbi:TPA: hypothetical protein OND32_002410 [Enterobacter asburiae]|nr:hypothetical protein [Enterobacter asburiae]
MAGSIFIDLIIVSCSLWAFSDAIRNDIGAYTIEDGINKGYKNGISPVVWGVGSLFVLPFIIYVFRRKSLISQAKDHPVKTDRSLGFIILFLVTASLLMFSYRDILFS